MAARAAAVTRPRQQALTERDSVQQHSHADKGIITPALRRRSGIARLFHVAEDCGLDGPELGIDGQH
jgi:hypothetical protein